MYDSRYFISPIFFLTQDKTDEFLVHLCTGAKWNQVRSKQWIITFTICEFKEPSDVN